MYHSKFYDTLYRLNSLSGWRKLLRSEESDLHMKDIEILLRGFAMLIDKLQLCAFDGQVPQPVFAQV